MNRVFAFLIAAVASLSASAATVYQYVGTNYTTASSPYTTAQRVTGQFTTASPLAPNLPLASVLAQRHLAHVHAHASPQRHVQSGQAAVVVEREAQRIGGALEQQQEAVAAADLAAAPAAHQLARGAIVSRPQRHHDGVTQLVVEPGAVDDIGHQQRKGFAHGRVAVGGCGDTRARRHRTLTRACRGLPRHDAADMALRREAADALSAAPVTAATDPGTGAARPVPPVRAARGRPRADRSARRASAWR